MPARYEIISQTIRTDFICLLGFVLLFWVTACENKKTCKFRPEAMFSKGYPITDYNYRWKDSIPGSIMLDRWFCRKSVRTCAMKPARSFGSVSRVILRLNPFFLAERGCPATGLEYVFRKQIALKSWADIELRRQRDEAGSGSGWHFVRVDKVTNLDQATLIVLSM